MKIIIYQNREVYKENSKIGNDSENKVETLEFEFPEEYADFTKYIEFQIKGEKYVDLIEGNKYVITREVAKYGKIKTQVVLKKNTENDVMVFKSDIFTLNVSNSINATENLVHTVGIDLIEKIVTKNSEQDVRLDALEADNIINKSNISNIQTEQTNQNNRLDSLELDNTTNKTDILNIKQEQITQNTNIQELQTDNTSNKSKIADLETKNAEQDTNIQKNTDDIAEINAKNTAQDEEIAQLKEKNTTQDELIEQLQAENTKLKKEINSMQIPGEATGNPIHLSDSSDLECEIVVKGNAGQETREGYNLFNEIYTMGYFTDDAGNTNTSNIGARATDYIAVGDYTTLYILFNCLQECKLARLWLMEFDENFNAISRKTTGLWDTSFSVGNTIKTVTLSEGTKYIKPSFYNLNVNDTSLTYDSFKNYFNICISTKQVSDYEPYGASPSPDYPSPVKTVGQNVNLISNNPDDWEQGSIDGNKGTLISSTTRIRTKGFIDIVQKQYYIKLQDTNYCLLNILFYANDDSFVGQYYNIDSTINGASSKALTFPETCKKIKITLRKKDNTSNILPSEILSIKPKLEKGTIATPYSKYGQGSVEIKVCNKNFIKMSDSQQIKNNGITATKIERGWNIQGTSTAFVALNLGEVIAKAGTHTFSTNFSKSSLGVYVRLRDKTTNAIVAEIGNNQVTSRIYTINTDINANFVINIPSGTTVDIQITETQFEKSPTKTNYIEHESYTKVLPIQQEMLDEDYIDDVEYHEWGKVIFNGDEEWKGNWQNSAQKNSKSFVLPKSFFGEDLPDFSTAELAICSHFQDVKITVWGFDYNCIALNSDENLSLQIRLTKDTLQYEDDVSTEQLVSLFKTLLKSQYDAGTPVTLYYKLAEPKALELTEEQKAVLNSFYTYKGITNISVDGIGTLKVNYKKDLETLINNIATSVAE